MNAPHSDTLLANPLPDWPVQPRRHRGLWGSALLCVLLPVLMTAGYLLTLAADRYAAEVKFTLRTPAGATDLLGVMGALLPAAAPLQEGYMIEDYLNSAALIGALQDRLDLQAIYGGAQADPLLRLPDDAGPIALKRRFDWLSRIYLDTASNVVTVEVQAYTPQDAERLAAAVLDSAATLVADLSARARADTLAAARADLSHTQTVLRDSRQALAAFRSQSRDIDPAGSAAARQALLADLRARAASLRAERRALLDGLPADAPPVRARDAQLTALHQEIAAQQAELNRADSQDSPARLARYEALQTDLDFAQRSYLSALAALEAARIEADRQQRSLSLIVPPSPPEEARYPRPAHGIALVALITGALWVIGVMGVYILREHAT